jgi:ABC-type multidrug transport system ATPase subunit
MITVRNVTKRFGKTTVLDKVTLDVAAGESIAFWGPNGAGKSTLLRCILGLYRFDGSVTVGGHDSLRDGKKARSLIGYVPQELAFYDDLRAGEAVRFFASLKGVAVPSVDMALGDVGLLGHAGKQIRALSGGMKQRLALAVAMLGDPPVLVLDEVTASLDACGRDEFIGLLSRLSGTGRTLLFASHRVEEIAALAGRVVVLERGRVVRTESTDAFARGQTADATLHLTMPLGDRAEALHTLRTAGFFPRLNGVGLLVPVSHDRKATPFRLLADAQLRIDDFELISGHHAHAEVHQ